MAWQWGFLKLFFVNTMGLIPKRHPSSAVLHAVSQASLTDHRGWQPAARSENRSLVRAPLYNIQWRRCADRGRPGRRPPRPSSLPLPPRPVYGRSPNRTPPLNLQVVRAGGASLSIPTRALHLPPPLVDLSVTVTSLPTSRAVQVPRIPHTISLANA